MKFKVEAPDIIKALDKMKNRIEANNFRKAMSAAGNELREKAIETHNEMMKRMARNELLKIKAWWWRFRRGCVRQSLIRHHGWTASKVTERVLDDVEYIAERVKLYPLQVTSTEMIGAYMLDRDIDRLFRAVVWLLKKQNLVNREMIFWAISNGKADA